MDDLDILHDPPLWSHGCKHCDALGMECDGCDGAGCEACDGEGVVPASITIAERTVADIMRSWPDWEDVAEQTAQVEQDHAAGELVMARKLLDRIQRAIHTARFEWSTPEVAARWPEASTVLAKIPDGPGYYYKAINWWRPDWLYLHRPGTTFVLLQNGPHPHPRD